MFVLPFFFTRSLPPFFSARFFLPNFFYFDFIRVRNPFSPFSPLLNRIYYNFLLSTFPSYVQMLCPLTLPLPSEQTSALSRAYLFVGRHFCFVILFLCYYCCLSTCFVNKRFLKFYFRISPLLRHCISCFIGGLHRAN